MKNELTLIRSQQTIWAEWSEDYPYQVGCGYAGLMIEIHSSLK